MSPALARGPGAAQAYRRACLWDVAAFKPGNVSLARHGHRMQAADFIASAAASAGAIGQPGAAVGNRIEAAVAATWQAVGCNTNLGIVLLCAPLACAMEQAPSRSARALRDAWEQVMAGLDRQDAAAAYRAIAQAQPGGLGRAESEDVHQAPSLGLREAMALAADRDAIAAQYVNGASRLFETGWPVLKALAWPPAGWAAATDAGDDQTLAQQLAADAAGQRAVSGLYLALLAAGPDSHIVRKHGLSVAHSVMAEAADWWRRWRDDPDWGQGSARAEWADWDTSLKSRGLNPGTTADLTVATLMAAHWAGV